MAKGKSLCIEWWEKQMYTFTKNIFIRDEAQHMRGGGGLKCLNIKFCKFLVYSFDLSSIVPGDENNFLQDSLGGV